MKTQKERENVLELREAGNTYAEIVRITGISYSCVWNICNGKNPQALPAKQKRIAEMQAFKSQGHTAKEVAERFGVSESYATEKCIGINPICRNQHKKTTFDEERKYVESFLHGRFSYIGGYIDCDHDVTIKCNTCGHVFERSMITIRKKNKATCPVCYEAEQKAEQERRAAERAEQKRTEQEERERQGEQRRHDKEIERLARKRTAVCPECGKEFITFNRRAVCCSQECTRHRGNRKHDKRIAKAKRIDNITVKELYKKDAGICWICGGKCNLDDYITRGGTIICGDYYPSVDHIVPVCNGGEDAWSNVRLAHRRCNLERYLRESRPPRRKTS